MTAYASPPEDVFIAGEVAAPALVGGRLCSAVFASGVGRLEALAA